MKNCIKCGKELRDEVKFCTGCGQVQDEIQTSLEQVDDREAVYYDQDDGYTEGLVEKQSDTTMPGLDANTGGIPDGARCRYCLGPISKENGECLLCHRPYFEKVDSELENEAAEEKDNADNGNEVNIATEPRCRYCNGKISEETGRCLLCNRPYNEKETEADSSQAQNRGSTWAGPSARSSASPPPKPSVGAMDASFESIRNSNSRYKEDLEKYGTSGSYNGNVLFERVGSKIMGLAKVIFWIVVIINLLISIYMIYGAIKSENYALVVPALIVAGAGVVAGWLSSVLLYGYGQLIESQQTAVDELSEIKQLLRKKDNK